MTGIGMVYAAINRIIDMMQMAYADYKQAADHLSEHPASLDAKRACAVAQVVLEEELGNERTRFSDSTASGIAMMSRKNKARIVDEPSNAEINILTALSMIRHPSDEFLYSVANTLKGNRMSLMAMDAIVRAAWADVPDHKCETYSDMLKPVMSIQEADEAIAKIKKLCDKIKKEDATEIVKRQKYANMNDLIVREVGVDPDMFTEAVSDQ